MSLIIDQDQLLSSSSTRRRAEENILAGTTFPIVDQKGGYVLLSQEEKAITTKMSNVPLSAFADSDSLKSTQVRGNSSKLASSDYDDGNECEIIVFNSNYT